MSSHAIERLLGAAVLAGVLACGGGGGGPGVPGHQPSAEEATKLAGIGDSIMQGYDAGCGGQSSIGEQPSCSFAQGTAEAVVSLYSRYKAVSGLTGGEDFASESGAEMIGRPDGLPNALDQATTICAQSPRPNRVVILLGGNDVCHSADVASLPTVGAFRAALKAALDELAGCPLPSGSRVHVLSIPRIDRLYQAVAGKQSTYNVSCTEVWAYAQICPIVTGGSSAAVGTQIVAYNDGILTEVMAANDAHAGTGIHFSTDWTGASGTSIGTFLFAAGDVSDIDCFHPSAEGQRKLACGAWESWEGLGNAPACF